VKAHALSIMFLTALGGCSLPEVTAIPERAPQQGPAVSAPSVADIATPEASAQPATSTDEIMAMTSVAPPIAGADAPLSKVMCAQNPCVPGGDCVVDPTGVASCRCFDGYNGTGTLACTKIDECAGNPCGVGGTCTDQVGAHSCTCAPGYSGTGSQHCTNVDDCGNSTCGVGGRCIDGVQGYKCQCYAGYSGTGTMRCTDDIDECESDPCAPGGTCKEGVNSHTCTCSFSADTENRCPHKDNGDGTLYDADTMLTWQKSRTTLPWNSADEEAAFICAQSQVAGGGWRNPTCGEVDSITRVIDPTSMLHFQGADAICAQQDSPEALTTVEVLCVR